LFWRYLTQELLGRKRQAILVALGLGLGIGLVVTVTSMSSGVADAQSKVLHSLYGVGTDVTVTQPARAGTSGPARFGFGDRRRGGQQFARDRVFVSPGQALLSDSTVSAISNLSDVRQAAGGIRLTGIHFSGKLPKIQPGFQGPGFAIGSGSGQGGGLGPSSFKIDTYSIQGVDVSALGIGPLSSADIVSGRTFTTADASSRVTVLSQGYAKQHKLSAGSTITISGSKYTVVGVVSGTSGTDVYVPLFRAQAMAGESGKVTTVYVRAASASDIPKVSKEISAALPKATVTTASDLASQVSGSLATASNLAGTLGRWLSLVALIAAFALASLLTLSAVSRRTRELGTLRAIGWRKRRVVGQIMGETMTQGLLGGILGLGLGIGGALLASKLMPALTASVAGFGGAGGGAAAGGAPFARASQSVSVHMAVSIGVPLLALAIALAIAGGLVSGAFGGWRAARLRPAEAMRRVD
jgi:ABC-type antimicrobial peptide transport system permease subunit